MKRSETSRSERRGIVLVQLALLLVVVIGVVCWVVRQGITDDPEGRGHRKAANPSASQPGLPEQTTTKAESFYFDPNTADSLELSRLGLSVYQIQNIYRYRAKGGQFHRAEDFKKLYGLTVGQWKHLQPLIRIGEEYQYLADTPDAYKPTNHPFAASREEVVDDGANERSNAPYGRAHRDTTLYPYKLRPGETIDLNQADTITLRRVSGIGPIRARKIVQYREILGGFVSPSQLNDLDFLPLGIEAHFTVGDNNIRKMRLNRATFRELNNHPYINYYQARAIVNAVRQIGPFHNIQELLRCEEFTEADLQRLEPYLDFAE